jgi:1-acyl-sn-glycerol-3-phosphate acyltransferase
MIKRIRNDHRPGGVVPDGPQGPREKVQAGVIYLAQKTGYPIVPVTYSAKRCKVFNSWDRFIFPFPATPCVLIYGQPIRVPPDSDLDQIQRCAQALEDELKRITAVADARFDHVLDTKWNKTPVGCLNQGLEERTNSRRALRLTIHAHGTVLRNASSKKAE